MATRVAASPRFATTLMVTERDWQIPSELAHVERVVAELVALCEAAGLPARLCRFNVPMAVTEALANAILRGNGGEAAKHVHVHVELSAHRLLVDVTDEGPGFDLGALEQGPHEATWLEREQGRGVFLMRALMDAVENAGPDERGGHRLRLTLHRP
ncbi:MAG: ATP-binding protein [Gemmatimonadetes bacterium]|nr:ATP-binding protein [Gemmatimonadota bacterium]